MVLESTPIEFVLPASNHQRGDGVAGHVDDRAAHAEKAIDTKNQRHSGNRYRGNDHHGGDQRDKSGSLHATRAFGGKHGDSQDRKLLCQAEVRVGRLGYEERRESHVQTGAIGIEGIPGRNHEADQSFRASEFFEFGHQSGQHRFRGACSQHDENLLTEEPEESEDAKACHTRNSPQQDHNEQCRGNVERSQTVFANSEGHGAESPNGSKAHEDGENSKNDSSQGVQEVDKWPAARACKRQREAEEKRNKQNLKDVSPRERVEDRGGDDVYEKVRDALRFGLSRIICHSPCVQSSGIDIEAATGLHYVTDRESDQKRKCRDNFEIQKGLTADTADLLHVFHARNPGDQGAEDDQRNNHGDQANKRVAERLHRHSFRRADVAEEDGHSDAEQYLE